MHDKGDTEISRRNWCKDAMVTTGLAVRSGICYDQHNTTEMATLFVWHSKKTVFVLLLFARECYTDCSQQRGQRTQRRIVLFSQSALVFVQVFGDATKAKPIKLAEWGLQYFVEHFGTELGTTNRLFPEECEGPHSGGGQHTPNSIEHHHHHHVLPIFWGKSNFVPRYGGML